MSVSPERLMVAFLKADTDVNTATGGRIATSLPNTPELPFITVTLVGGGPEAGEAPVDQYLIQIDCWADTRGDADTLFRHVVDALRATNNWRHSHGHLRPVGVSNVRQNHDTDAADRYRYTVDAFAQMSA